MLMQKIKILIIKQTKIQQKKQKSINKQNYPLILLSVKREINL